MQNKQIATSKDTTKDRQLVEKFCYFKNGLTYQIKKAKQILFYISLKNEEISSDLLIKLRTVGPVSTKSIR